MLRVNGTFANQNVSRIRIQRILEAESAPTPLKTSKKTLFSRNRPAVTVRTSQDSVLELNWVAGSNSPGLVTWDRLGINEKRRKVQILEIPNCLLRIIDIDAA